MVLHNLYASSNIIRVIKSRSMRWVGHVTRMGAMRDAYKMEQRLEFPRPTAN